MATNLPGTRGPKPGNITTVYTGVNELEAPHDLSNDVQEKWDQLIGLMPASYFVPSDRDMLEIYCETWVMWRESLDETKIFGHWALSGGKTAHAAVKRHNRSVLEKELSSRLTSLAFKLGISPAKNQRNKVELPKTSTLTVLDGAKEA